MLRLLVTIPALSLALGCSSNGDEGSKEAAPAEKKKPRDKSNVKRIVTAVPPGQTVACADLLPDLSKLKEYVAEDIGEIVDRGKKRRSASAVCRIMKARPDKGKPGKLRGKVKETQKLGVLPGDEYCTITLYCSLATDEADFKRKCETDAKREAATGSMTIYEGNTDLGQFACVRKTDRPPSDYAYTYRTIDADTRCIAEVMGGPSVVDEGLVRNCTRAALESVGMQHLKKWN